MENPKKVDVPKPQEEVLQAPRTVPQGLAKQELENLVPPVSEVAGRVHKSCDRGFYMPDVP